MKCLQFVSDPNKSAVNYQGESLFPIGVLIYWEKILPGAFFFQHIITESILLGEYLFTVTPERHICGTSFSFRYRF